MAEFYVEKSANETGNHVVHNATCASLPAKDTLVYIGARSNVAAPLNEAALYQLSPSTPCPECIPN